jgi:hypothetical protein
MSKKGESISMSVIIIAAIALLVLVVLAVLILRSGTSVGQGTGCEGTGGRCTADEECGIGFAKDITKTGRIGGCKDDEICCVRVERETEE